MDVKTMEYLDLTGRFPKYSSSFHEYELVGYNYDVNSILVEPLKNRQSKNIIDGWDKINQKVSTEWVQPHTDVIGNEASKTLNKSFEKYTVNYQLVPPYSHHENKAERVIQIFKDHFKTGFSTLYPELLLYNGIYCVHKQSWIWIYYVLHNWI